MRETNLFDHIATKKLLLPLTKKEDTNEHFGYKDFSVKDWRRVWKDESKI